MYDVSLNESYFPAFGGLDVEAVTIGQMLREAAQTYGGRDALVAFNYDGDVQRVWTYQDFAQDSERLARALASRHPKGARIAVWAPNIPEWTLLEFASAVAGVTLVTVNPSYQARELKYVLEQSGAEAIYYVESFRGNPMQEIADKVCNEIPAIKHRILLTGTDELFAGADDGVLPDVHPGDPVQIQYTSGTTGFPKGAVLHHTGLVVNARHTLGRANICAGDKVMHVMPLFHTTGCAILALGSIAVGATVLLPPIFDPAMVAKVIEREKAQFFLGVPTMIIALIEEIENSHRDVSSIRQVVSGGAMVAPELVKKSEKVLGAPVQIVYGQTESSPVITMAWQDDSVEDLSQTIGQPLPHVDVSIRDPITNLVSPIGAQGEICARGYLVMTEYHNNPEATASAVDSDGWLHTGDLGRMDARGYLKITGRVKEMIIRGGENLFPAEIENAMLENDAIAEVAVAGVPDEKWGEQVACFMRAAGKERPGADALKAFIRERLSPQKTPAYWIYVDEWPLTGSGKIQKFKLRGAFEKGEFTVLRA